MTYTAGPASIEHIAQLVHEERPEWDAGLVKVVLHSHAGHVDGTDLAVAALRAAKDPRFPTPKAIGWRGPHWDGLATVPPEIARPERCYHCGKSEPRCYSTRTGPDDHHFETQRDYLVRIGKDPDRG